MKALYEDPRWTELERAWRDRYQQSRKLLQQALPSLRRLASLDPLLFDSGTQEGQERRENVLQMMDDGDYLSLKEFINHWEPHALERAIEQARIDELKAASQKKDPTPHALP